MQPARTTVEREPFGRLVAHRRNALGLSQRDLADRICAASGRATVTRHELSRYERGVRLPTTATVTALAVALNMAVSALADAAAATRTLRRHTRHAVTPRPGGQQLGPS